MELKAGKTGADKTGAVPKATRARDYAPRPAESKVLNSSTIAAQVAAVAAGQDGRLAPALPAQQESALAAPPAWAANRPRSSSCLQAESCRLSLSPSFSSFSPKYLLTIPTETTAFADQLLLPRLEAQAP